MDTHSDVSGVASLGKTFLPADIMNDDLLWLLSDDPDGHSGERFVASFWGRNLPIAERIRAARQPIVVLKDAKKRAAQICQIQTSSPSKR